MVQCVRVCVCVCVWCVCVVCVCVCVCVCAHTFVIHKEPAALRVLCCQLQCRLLLVVKEVFTSSFNKKIPYSNPLLLGCFICRTLLAGVYALFTAQHIATDCFERGY